MRVRLVVPAAVAAFAAALAAGAAPRAMTPVDLLSIPVQGEVQLAPDAGAVLFTRSAADWDEDRLVTHVWRIQADGTELLQMTNGTRGERAPRWSPDGQRFCFLARRGDEETQLWVQSNRGGEATQLTHHETSVSDPEWSPDGTSVYFLADDPPSEEEKALEKASGGVISFDRDFAQQHLWSVDVATGAEKRLTEGEFSVLEFSISRSGATVVYQAGPTPLYDDFDESEIYVRPVAGGTAVRLTDNTVFESGAALSPDGSTVLFVADADSSFETYHQGNMFLVPAGGGGDATMLLPDFPGEVLDARWTDDGAVVFLANTGVRTQLFSTSPGSDRATPLTTGDHTVSRWDLVAADGGTLAWIESTPSSPGDVVLSALDGSDRSRITGFGADLGAAWRFPRTEVVSWPGADGVEVEGILTYPLDYRAGTRYPLVVQTHGGPASSSTLRFPSWATYQPVLAAMGYAVLQPNYRGSTGYGDTFLRDMVGHYFNQADDDVVAGTQAMVDRGLADPEALVTMGWSAGGHMTDWLVTHTDLYAAASSGAGAANWVSMYAQSDVRTYRTPWFLGTPWQKDAPLDRYMENSPIFSVWRATTPTLILVGENDVRVPMPQSVEMFRGLRANGVDTELLVFPGEPHGLRTLKHRLHKINAELEWFERHVFGRTYELQKPPARESEDAPPEKEEPEA